MGETIATDSGTISPKRTERLTERMERQDVSIRVQSDFKKEEDSQQN
jgi:hypothetical protein